MRAPLWVIACWLLATTAHAHAPLARSALVNNDGSVIVRMPGFGLVLRSPENVVSYACDALLGLNASVQHTTLATRDDNAFLLGAAERPLRIVSLDGCTSSAPTGWPETLGVSAIARDDNTEPNSTYFAVSAETSPALYRSIDNGEHWQLQTRFDPSDSITGLRVVQPSAGPARIYATRPSGVRTTLLVSIDDGSTFTATDLASDLTLLDVRAGTVDQLWLLSPHPESGDVAVVRGPATATTFETVHRVRFFGGLALDATNDTVWIADEAGALVRSTNGGDTFEATRADLAVACLVHRDGKLWACTAGTNQERALAVSDDGGEHFSDVFAFAQVDRLVSCDLAVGAPTVCAAAWTEWQRDVLELTPSEPSDDAGTAPAVVESMPSRKHHSCSTTVGLGNRYVCFSYVLSALWLVRRRRAE